ncbi:SAM-dependent methyltransferase [Actinomadura fibrosa]|uniref:SAM-dependent methyltransferase n=1 Tax=Actinomadura fibrosa TaxID=111802 RepID=A0ABW2Y1H2_9ACTN|nr:SAM-dependent methyltransferase [Actinomadura fibrosa]
MSERSGSGKPAFTYDPSKPSIARVYDHWLGGKDNFAADRRFAADLADVLPDIYTIVRANRAFLGAAVRHLVRDHGITQFLDMGAGLPTARNVHEVAQECDPAARVVYVDNDAEVTAHGRALLADDARTGIVEADLRDPDAVLSDAATTALLDPREPVAVMLVSILHFIGDEDRPHDLVARYMGAVPSGSFLVLSTACANPVGDKIEDLYRDRIGSRGGGGAISRSMDEILRFFDGLDLLPPGLTTVTRWRPGHRVEGQDVPFVAGVARKP